jgi:N-acetylmuramic acid 6-phosphate etherase
MDRQPERFDLLLTEQRNPRTMELDRLSVLELLQVMNEEDRRVPEAVGRVLPAIARAVEGITARLRQGGRLLYFGAGTSGRLGILDAAECLPTFNAPPEQVRGFIAGGPAALTRPIEGAEDDAQAGAADVHAAAVSAQDVVVGLTASGRTPYVLGALQAARERGAFTVGVVCSVPSPLEPLVDVLIAPLVGPEIIAGSTRLKAGTAQKLVLNMLSTATMVQLGKVYGNLMVDVRATNAKLRDRAVRIVMAATGVDRATAEAALAQAGGECKTAIVMLVAGVDRSEAERRLAKSGGRVREALQISRAEEDRAQV